jgi:hypothetical protein
VSPRRRSPRTGPQGPVRTVAASLARRRDARAPRVLVSSGSGQSRSLAPDDPLAEELLAAAEALVLAAQRGSGR